jgi:hypothetical protein
MSAVEPQSRYILNIPRTTFDLIQIGKKTLHIVINLIENKGHSGDSSLLINNYLLVKAVIVVLHRLLKRTFT